MRLWAETLVNSTKAWSAALKASGARKCDPTVVAQSRTRTTAVMNRDHRALPSFTPDAPHNGFQPNAMFIHRPMLDLAATQRCFEFLEDEANVFLNCSCTSTLALA